MSRDGDFAKSRAATEMLYSTLLNEQKPAK